MRFIYLILWVITTFVGIALSSNYPEHSYIIGYIDGIFSLIFFILSLPIDEDDNL